MISKALKIAGFTATILVVVILALASEFVRLWKLCKQSLNSATLRPKHTLYLNKHIEYAVEQYEIEAKDDNKAQFIELTNYAMLKHM